MKRWMIGGLVWLACVAPVTAQEPQERPLPDQLEMTRLLLERAQNDYGRCQLEYADLHLKAKKLMHAHQTLLQERQPMLQGEQGLSVPPTIESFPPTEGHASAPAK